MPHWCICLQHHLHFSSTNTEPVVRKGYGSLKSEGFLHLAQVLYGCPQPSSHCRAAEHHGSAHPVPPNPGGLFMGVNANKNSSSWDGDWLTSKQSGIFFVGAKAVPTGECSLILNEKLGILMRIRAGQRNTGLWAWRGGHLGAPPSPATTNSCSPSSPGAEQQTSASLSTEKFRRELKQRTFSSMPTCDRREILETILWSQASNDGMHEDGWQPETNHRTERSSHQQWLPPQYFISKSLHILDGHTQPLQHSFCNISRASYS